MTCGNGIVAWATYANVFPEPVTASTTTSLFPINIGIAASCTGVILVKPITDIASRIHSDKGGVSASHCRRRSLDSGAMDSISSCFEIPGRVLNARYGGTNGSKLPPATLPVLISNGVCWCLNAKLIGENLYSLSDCRQ